MKRTYLFAAVLLAGCSTAAAISAEIAKACADAKPVIDTVGPIVSVDPIGATTVASLQAACTVDGQIQMTLNDGKPVTPTNSGHSAGWVQQSLAYLQTVAQALAPTPASSK